MHLAADQPLGRADRRAALALGLGRQQVAEPFGLGQIDPAGTQRTPGELAGLRRPQPRLAAEHLLHRADHRPSAM